MIHSRGHISYTHSGRRLPTRPLKEHGGAAAGGFGGCCGSRRCVSRCLLFPRHLALTPHGPFVGGSTPAFYVIGCTWTWVAAPSGRYLRRHLSPASSSRGQQLQATHLDLRGSCAHPLPRLRRQLNPASSSAGWLAGRRWLAAWLAGCLASMPWRRAAFPCPGAEITQNHPEPLRITQNHPRSPKMTQIHLKSLKIA